MKAYLYAALAIAMGLSHLWIFNHGKKVCEAKHTLAALEFREKEANLIKQLQEAKANREVIVRDRVKVIEKTPDPTGCLNTPYPQSVIDELHKQAASH